MNQEERLQKFWWSRSFEVSEGDVPGHTDEVKLEVRVCTPKFRRPKVQDMPGIEITYPKEKLSFKCRSLVAYSLTLKGRIV